MTDWSAHVRYFCVRCGAECINHIDSTYARQTCCRSCSVDPQSNSEILREVVE